MRYIKLFQVVVIISFLASTVEAKDTQKDKAISIYCSIVNKKTEYLARYFKDEIYYSQISYYGEFFLKNNYDGFVENKGELFRLIYGSGGMFPGFSDVLSFRSAFLNANHLYYYCIDGRCDRYARLLSVQTGDWAYSILFNCSQVDQCVIEGFEVMPSGGKKDHMQIIDLGHKNALCIQYPK